MSYPPSLGAVDRARDTVLFEPFPPPLSFEAFFVFPFSPSFLEQSFAEQQLQVKQRIEHVTKKDLRTLIQEYPQKKKEVCIKKKRE
jgi:hypothetical protein